MEHTNGSFHSASVVTPTSIKGSKKCRTESADENSVIFRGKQMESNRGEINNTTLLATSFYKTAILHEHYFSDTAL